LRFFIGDNNNYHYARDAESGGCADVMSEAWASFASGNVRGKTVGGGGTPPSMLSQAGSISLLASADVLVSA
jgi:hypothetical protein